MKDWEKLFSDELEIFRSEAYEAAQYCFIYLTINARIYKNKKALTIINRTPIFWGSNINALQTSFFITLGRVFDNTSNHNIHHLLKLCIDHPEIFSKKALRNRRLKETKRTPDWIDEFINRAYEPTKNDFIKLKTHVDRYKNIYKNNYHPIRNKIFAHNVLKADASAKKLFANTNIGELQRLIVFLIRFNEVLWELFNNGRKPVLRNMPFSVTSMRKKDLQSWRANTVQERVVDDTAKFFDAFLGTK